MRNYVHGYTKREHTRLFDQANTLTGLLHGDTHYPKGSKVLEAGCGVGAQTVILAKNSPGALIISMDISSESLDKARSLIKKSRINNVEFRIADIFDLPFEDNTFDHVFVCFVLEHLREPIKALKNLKKVLKKEGTLTVIEGDHETSLFYPESKDAMKTIRCLIDIQKKLGGDSLIGRRLYPLLKKAGFNNINISPRFVYADESRPKMTEGFTKKTYIAMVKGVEKQAIACGMIDKKTWNKGIRDLSKSARKGGVFCYTFFKGTAEK